MSKLAMFGLGLGLVMLAGATYWHYRTPAPSAVPSDESKTDGGAAASSASKQLPGTLPKNEAFAKAIAKEAEGKRDVPQIVEDKADAKRPTIPPAAEGIAPKEVDLASLIVFMLHVDKKVFSFPNSQGTAWQDASAAIDQLVKEKVSANIRLSVTFPSQIITQQHSLENFQTWLARVGDYVFARRISIVDNLEDVIKNTELMRVERVNVCKIGCAKLHMQEELWTVTIRGLESELAELKIVGEKILFPAISGSKEINIGAPVKFDYVATHLEERKGTLLKANHGGLSNSLIRGITYEDAMMPFTDTNSHAFLPLVYLEQLTTNEEEIGEIKNRRILLLNWFYENVVLAEIGDKEYDEGKPEQIADTVETILDKLYDDLIGELVHWTDATRVSDIILRSLFIK